jgi:hypothetical protein
MSLLKFADIYVVSLVSNLAHPDFDHLPFVSINFSSSKLFLKQSNIKMVFI